MRTLAILCAFLLIGCTSVSAKNPHNTPAPTATPSPTPVPPNFRVAVVLINFTNDQSQPYTPAYANGIVFTNPNSTAVFYSESSYGQRTLGGDVFGWWTLPYPNSPCDTLSWKNAARAMTLAQGVNLDTDYDHVALAWPHTTACQFNGRAGSFYNTNLLDEKAVAHEIGHAFHLNHSNGRTCVDGTGMQVILSPVCTDQEYGDYFDTMGNQSGHWFSSWARTKLGWIDPPLVITASGTYDLASAEGTTGNRLIMIPRPDGTYFALEYRRPMGVFDQWQGVYANPPGQIDGVFVRIASNLPSDDLQHSFTVMLDMRADGGDVGYDPALKVGQSFSYDGITITTQAIDATHATVQVSM